MGILHESELLSRSQRNRCLAATSLVDLFCLAFLPRGLFWAFGIRIRTEVGECQERLSFGFFASVWMAGDELNWVYDRALPLAEFIVTSKLILWIGISTWLVKSLRGQPVKLTQMRSDEWRMKLSLAKMLFKAWLGCNNTSNCFQLVVVERSNWKGRSDGFQGYPWLPINCVKMLFLWNRTASKLLLSMQRRAA